MTTSKKSILWVKETLLVFSVLFLVSCARTPMEKAFSELDMEISKRLEYKAAFERRCDKLRDAFLCADADSSRWEAALRLYRTYIHVSADSAAHYIALMRSCACNPFLAQQTDLEKIRLLVWAHEENLALESFHSLDKVLIKEAGLQEQYYYTAIEIFRNLARYPTVIDESRNYCDSLNYYRLAFIGIAREGYEGKKIRAQYLRDEGKLDEALSIFEECLRQYGDDFNAVSSIYYNIADIYGKMGNHEARECNLAKSAVFDLRAYNRDLLSLYNLSTELFHDGEVSRASQYIRLHFEAVQAGGFPAKVIQSSAAMNDILKQAMRIERTKILVMCTSIALLAALLLVIFIMWREARRRGKVIARVNSELTEANRKLGEADKIKNEYIFRYMGLSVRYLDKIGEQRSDLRKIARNGGPEALMRELRAPAEQYADYKEFYRIFDTTFLGIFPNFIEQVNDLLVREIRFDVKESRKSLPTELRILAAIRLGMDESPMIAEFLKCSLSTVYTYRAKLRNRALCSKDDFEKQIKLIK